MTGAARNVLCACAALLFGGITHAAEYTYAWKTGEYPTSLHDGKITFTYTAENRIKNLKIDSAAGDRFVFTGDKMLFTNTDAYKIAYITNTTSGTLVFQNDADCRSVYVMCPSGSKTWHGYNTFVGTGDDWTTVLANANVDDFEPSIIKQDDRDQNGKWISYDSHNTLYPHQIVREPGRMTFQYQTITEDDNDRKRVKVIKAEVKQFGSDIKMRIIGAYAVFSPASAPVSKGFDVDTVWDGVLEKAEKPIRKTGGSNVGYGINTVGLTRITPCFNVRFEGNVKFTGSPTAYPSAGIEVADVAKGCASRTYPQPMGGTLALLDGSKTEFNWIPTGNSGSGMFLFATTKPTSSPAVTNLITLNSTFKTAAGFVVKGIDGYPMMLRIDNSTAFPTSHVASGTSYLYNGEVRVASGGILKLKCTGVNSVGVKGGACDFIVEKGGILQQAGGYLFGHTTMVSLNGGKIQLSVDEPYDWDTGDDLPQLTFRNGATIDNVSSNQSKTLRIGRTAPGATWYVSGETPSTNTAAIQFFGPGNFRIVTNTFNVAKLGDFDADFVCTKGIGMYTGGEQYRTNVLRKIGLGTMLVDGICTVPADNLIEGGTFKLGASNIWRGYGTTMTGNNYRADDPPPPIVLCGGTFAAAANTSNGLGRVTLTADSGLALDEGACFTCYDQSSVAWDNDARLTVTIPTNSVGALLGSIRFGTDKNGLTESQQRSIRLNGKRAMLDNAGWLQIRQVGTRIIVR